ncbi:hypothetical protein GCM10027082_19460 [Comamonas humi]
MNSRFPSRCGTLSRVLISLLLTACAAAPKDEPPPIAREPKLTPLPAAISQIDLKPSTATLSKGEKWLQDSERILAGETPK